MILKSLKDRLFEQGFTYAAIADRLGISIAQVRDFFDSEPEHTDYLMLQAISDIIDSANAEVHEPPAAYDCDGEPSARYPKQGSYTLEDYYALPDEQPVELIDGVFYDMTAPRKIHQLIAGEIYRQMANFLIEKNGPCLVFIAPHDVRLDQDDRTMVQPDLLVICRKEDLRSSYTDGAPDFVLEVISPSTGRKDYIIKLNKYRNAGVREYWILDPYQKILLTYEFEKSDIPVIHGLDDPVPVGIWNGALVMDLKHIRKWIAEAAGI